MVLPALLGMACVQFKEGNYHDCLEMYSKAITLFPHKAGASARVGLGLACYQLGQVDRAKAAFQRAHAMDPENVEAMVGIAVLDVASLDETLSRDKDYRKMAENAMRLISMANLIDHSNAMVQNHLANYYFNKWTPVTGVTVKVEDGNAVVVGSGPINLDAGERIRIGYQFETNIVEEDDGDMMDDDSNIFKIKDVWKGAPTGKLYIVSIATYLCRQILHLVSDRDTPHSHLFRWSQVMEKGLRSCHCIGQGSILIHDCAGNSSRVALHSCKSAPRSR
jgi:RNA polymerase-associated protein CTR9